MIDRTQLTEARRLIAGGGHSRVALQAIDLLLDFPTDEQVEAAVAVIDEEGDCGKAGVRAALEAVRDTMIGETP